MNTGSHDQCEGTTSGGKTGFYGALKKHQSKTFVDLYKAEVHTTQNVEKTIQADRKLLQYLLNVIIAGQTVEMVNVIKYEHGRDMNTTLKTDVISILMDGLHTPSDIPDADLKTCVLIDNHALIQFLRKPHG